MQVLVAIASILAAGLCPANAVVIAFYGFGDGVTKSKASTDADLLTTANEFAWGAGLGTSDNWNSSTAGVNNGNGSPAGEFAVKPLGNTPSQEESITDNSYWTFTVTPGESVEMDTTSLSFSRSVLNSNLHLSYFLSSSVDGFSNPITGTTQLAQTGSSYTTVNFDLNSITSLQNLTAPIEFRLYMWASNGGGSSGSRWGFDNITLNADLSTVPEPGMIPLLLGSLGAAFVMIRRRSRRALRFG